jgi:hypothetical protein
MALESSTSQSQDSYPSNALQDDNRVAGPSFAPFRNPSIYHLMTWFFASSNTKSLNELNSLVKDVILAPDFKSEHFFGFNATKEQAVMDSFHETASNTMDNPSPFEFDDTWIKGKVEILLPCEGFRFKAETDAPKFIVEVYHRKLIDVIKAALSEPGAKKFHIIPFKAFWKPALNSPNERIYSEMYTGDAWNEAYDKLQSRHQRGPNSHREAFIVGLLVYSDSTHLAQFGNAGLWPIYLYFGNQSKYSRGKPTSFAAHHIAYMPKVRI